MKRVLMCLILAAMFLTPGLAADDIVCFGDVRPDQWYYSSIRSVYEQGLMEGYSGTAFRPNHPLTRRELVRSLGLLAGIPTDEYRSHGTAFRDVDDSLAPYVAWAFECGITNGVSGTRFAPDDPVTREQLAAMLGRYVRAMGRADDLAEQRPCLLDEDQISPWAMEGYEIMLRMGIIRGNDQGMFCPQALTTRGETAAILDRMSDGPALRNWIDYTPPTEYDVPAGNHLILSPQVIARTADQHGILADSDAFRALCDINLVYGNLLSSRDRNRSLIFLFEGVGSTNDIDQRRNAMCVVVQNGQIVYLNLDSTTIPDDPFDPKKNYGTDMPTLRSGIYDYTAPGVVDIYANLHVEKAKVVRFRSREEFYLSTSDWIDIHLRAYNTIAPKDATWANSYGCCLIGAAGTGDDSDYMNFIRCVGMESGKVMIDRRYAGWYLGEIGYPQESIRMLG